MNPELNCYRHRDGEFEWECHSWEPSLKVKHSVHVWSVADTEQDALTLWEQTIRNMVARNEIALPEYLTNK